MPQLGVDVVDSPPEAKAEPQGDVKSMKPAESSRKTRMSTAGLDELQEELGQRSEPAKNARGSEGVFIREEDYEAILRNIGHKEQETGRLKKIVFGLLALILVLAGVTLATSIAAAELSKESHVTGSALVDTEGHEVSTKSGDFSVCQDGTLAGKGKCAVDAQGRRLQDAGGEPQEDSTLKTIPVKQKKVLTSSLSDTFFMSLNEVAVFSDKGHSLRFVVHGFARVPVANSRCGNIVHLYTAWNGRLTLDSTDLSFDAETEAHFENAGFSLAIGGVSGRRLALDHSVEGFFTAVQGVDAEGWTCQDVPLPSLPEAYTQQLTIYRPCAVAGTTGTSMDMCDSMYGGVMPGTAKLPRADQLATMSKTERIRAGLSVDVPIDSTLFLGFDLEVMKSPTYELQVSTLPNHPGQKKVNIFDRTTLGDIYFQVLAGMPEEGRFYCNTSGSEETPQKKAAQGEQGGVSRDMHFEFLDLVEEGGKLYRHFRMMPEEAFLDWMGAKAASDRPTDAYYEYWDEAETMTPHRLLNPDGSLVLFRSSVGGTTDEQVEAKLVSMGQSHWDSLLTCSSEEMSIEDPMAPTLGMAVPIMLSPMHDLTKNDLSFYAKLGLDTQVEADTSNGWETMQQRASGSDATGFAKYAMRALRPLAMPDVCSDVCGDFIEAVSQQLKADRTLELCDAPGLSGLVACIVDEAMQRSAQCGKSNFMKTYEEDCLAGAGEAADGGGRLLADDDDEGAWDDSEEQLEGSEEHLRRAKKLALQKGKWQKSGSTKTSTLTKLEDGSFAIDISSLDAQQKAQVAEALGVRRLSAGRVLFNATDHEPKQKVDAILQAEQPDRVESRRLMLDMNCIAPGVGPGCIFSVGYPWGCDPVDGSPRCWFGIAVKTQIGGPAHGALTVAGAGCVQEWAFGVPKPFSGSVCIDGGISVSWSGACGLPFSLSGWVGLTAQVGLDLVLFSFSFASLRIEAGASIENYKYNCDERRRRRDGWGGRRRGADMQCDSRCDIKVYAKATFQVLIGRVWLLVQYWVSNRDFDFIIGADIYIWLIFVSWWETVAQVQIV